jgi:trimeric autotransporter adhesin
MAKGHHGHSGGFKRARNQPAISVNGPEQVQVPIGRAKPAADISSAAAVADAGGAALSGSAAAKPAAAAPPAAAVADAGGAALSGSAAAKPAVAAPPAAAAAVADAGGAALSGSAAAKPAAVAPSVFMESQRSKKGFALPERALKTPDDITFKVPNPVCQAPAHTPTASGAVLSAAATSAFPFRSGAFPVMAAVPCAETPVLAVSRGPMANARVSQASSQPKIPDGVRTRSRKKC